MSNVKNPTVCNTCSKLTTNTLRWCQWCLCGVFIVNFEQVLHIILVFPLLTLNKKMPYVNFSHQTFHDSSTKSWNWDETFTQNLTGLESASNCNPMKYHIPDCISNLAIFDLLKTTNPTWKFWRELFYNYLKISLYTSLIISLAFRLLNTQERWRGNDCLCNWRWFQWVINGWKLLFCVGSFS